MITGIKCALEVNKYNARAATYAFFLPLLKCLFGLNYQLKNIDLTASSWLKTTLDWLELSDGG